MLDGELSLHYITEMDGGEGVKLSNVFSMELNSEKSGHYLTLAM